MSLNWIVGARMWMAAVAMIAGTASGLGAAAAQDGDAPGSMDPGMAKRGMAMCRMDEHIAGQLAYLKAELKITDSQTPQWNAFAETFRADKEKKAKLCRASAEQSSSMMSATLPESIKMMEDQLAERLESLRTIGASIQPLYSTLSKEQKKTADEIMKGSP